MSSTPAACKITDYYPPSPTCQLDLNVSEENADSKLIDGGDRISLTSTSGVLTPEHTPTKDTSASPKDTSCKSATSPSKKLYSEGTSSTDTELACIKEEISLSAGNDVKTSSDSPLPKVIKQNEKSCSPCVNGAVTKSKKARKRRQAKKEKAIPQSKNADSATQTAVKPKTSTKPKSKNPVSNNSLLTDYFPVRRSGRVTSTEIKKREQQDIEEAILSNKAEGLDVQDYGVKGRGVVATRPFAKGEFVVEYAGDLVSLQTAKKREEKYTGKLDIGCYMYYFNFNNTPYCIDATSESGKLGRLLNHSKTSPNCCTRVVGIDNRPFLILVAARQIASGEELVYDYGDRNKETLAANPWLAY